MLRYKLHAVNFFCLSIYLHVPTDLKAEAFCLVQLAYWKRAFTSATWKRFVLAAVQQLAVYGYFS